MRRTFATLLTVVPAIGVAAAVWSARMASSSDVQIAVITPAIAKHLESKEQEAAGLCPWRNRTTDMERFFPGADSAMETNFVVSSQRLAVSKRLGRTPTGDENALRAYCVIH